MILIACGAYGRPTTEKDWEDGKDFQAINGSFLGAYFSIRDCKTLSEEYGITHIEFRNREMTKIIFTEKI